MSKTKKLLIAAVCLVAILTSAVVGTIAWLSDKTTTVTNTFSPSTINIELTETNNLDLQMVPGKTITKDPVVTVKANSEDCWLFVKIDEDLGAWTAEGKTFSDYLSYSVIIGEDDWMALDGVPGVYYRQVDASIEDQSFDVLVDDEVNVLGTVTKADMDMLYVEGAVQPTLSFTAYAIQSEYFAYGEADEVMEMALAAWAAASAQANN